MADGTAPRQAGRPSWGRIEFAGHGIPLLADARPGWWRIDDATAVRELAPAESAVALAAARGEGGGLRLLAVLRALALDGSSSETADLALVALAAGAVVETQETPRPGPVGGWTRILFVPEDSAPLTADAVLALAERLLDSAGASIEAGPAIAAWGDRSIAEAARLEGSPTTPKIGEPRPSDRPESQSTDASSAPLPPAPGPDEEGAAPAAAMSNDQDVAASTDRAASAGEANIAVSPADWPDHAADAPRAPDPLPAVGPQQLPPAGLAPADRGLRPRLRPAFAPEPPARPAPAPAPPAAPALRHRRLQIARDRTVATGTTAAAQADGGAAEAAPGPERRTAPDSSVTAGLERSAWGESPGSTSVAQRWDGAITTAPRRDLAALGLAPAAAAIEGGIGERGQNDRGIPGPDAADWVAAAARALDRECDLRGIG